MPIPAHSGEDGANMIDGAANDEMPVWRVTCTNGVVAAGKTVRSPLRPRLKFTGLPCSWARICREVAVMLCVVKRLAAAMSFGPTPPLIAIGSASSRFFRYAFSAGSFVWPKLRS